MPSLQVGGKSVPCTVSLPSPDQSTLRLLKMAWELQRPNLASRTRITQARMSSCGKAGQCSLRSYPACGMMKNPTHTSKDVKLWESVGGQCAAFQAPRRDEQRCQVDSAGRRVLHPELPTSVVVRVGCGSKGGQSLRRPALVVRPTLQTKAV